MFETWMVLFSKVSKKVDKSLCMEEFDMFMSKDDVGRGDNSGHFTTNDIFAMRDDLLEWVRWIAFGFDCVVVTLISNKTNEQSGKKTYVLLKYEMSGKYRKYKSDLQQLFLVLHIQYCYHII